jgi:hypothetical protein
MAETRRMTAEQVVGYLLKGGRAWTFCVSRWPGLCSS